MKIITIRPGKWRKQWWKYNLIPHFHAVDVEGKDGNVTHRWIEFVWGTIIVDVCLPVKREPGTYKLAWSWPKLREK